MALNPSAATGPRTVPALPTADSQQAQGAFGRGLSAGLHCFVHLFPASLHVCMCLFRRPDPGQLCQELPHS